MQRPSLALILASVLLLAGCLGGGGDTSLDEQSAAGNTTTEAPVNESSTPEFTWTHEEKTGTVEGTNAAAVTVGAEQESVRIVEGATNLILNFTAEDGELWVDIVPPGCSGGASSDCSHRADTTDGTSTWSTTNPESGAWTVYLYKGDPGVSPVDYVVSIDQLAPTST